MGLTPVILSIETATLGGSVSLSRGAQELGLRTGDPAVSHSNSLLRDISYVLERAGLSLNEIQLFACASGPGSFTGLRIGIATLKALSATLDVPCVGIPTLEAVAHAAGHSDNTVALMPAGRGEVFCQLFSSVNGVVTPMDRAAHLSPEGLMEKYGELETVLWAGSGAHAQRDRLINHAQARGLAFRELSRGPEEICSGWKLLAPISNLARHVSALAHARFERGLTQSPYSLSAIYVRPSDAELNEHVSK